MVVVKSLTASALRDSSDIPVIAPDASVTPNVLGRSFSVTYGNSCKNYEECQFHDDVKRYLLQKQRFL